MLRHTGDILRITLSDIQRISYARISLGRAAKDNRLICRRYSGVIPRAISATYLIRLCVYLKGTPNDSDVGAGPLTGSCASTAMRTDALEAVEEN